MDHMYLFELIVGAGIVSLLSTWMAVQLIKNGK